MLIARQTLVNPGCAVQGNATLAREVALLEFKTDEQEPPSWREPLIVRGLFKVLVTPFR